MLLSLLSDQISKFIQLVRQAVVQSEHSPEFLNPMPGGQKRQP